MFGVLNMNPLHFTIFTWWMRNMNLLSFLPYLRGLMLHLWAIQVLPEQIVRVASGKVSKFCEAAAGSGWAFSLTWGRHLQLLMRLATDQQWQKRDRFQNSHQDIHADTYYVQIIMICIAKIKSKWWISRLPLWIATMSLLAEAARWQGTQAPPANAGDMTMSIRGVSQLLS